jgi:hypothetical protein
MNALVKVFLSVGFLVVASSASAQGQGRKPEPLPPGFNPGDAFPTMALPSAVDGRPISLADFRGKKVIVNVFASW